MNCCMIFCDSFYYLNSFVQSGTKYLKLLHKIVKIKDTAKDTLSS